MSYHQQTQWSRNQLEDFFQLNFKRNIFLCKVTSQTEIHSYPLTAPFENKISVFNEKIIKAVIANIVAIVLPGKFETDAILNTI